jgi:hypothetical protein
MMFFISVETPLGLCPRIALPSPCQKSRYLVPFCPYSRYALARAIRFFRFRSFSSMGLSLLPVFPGLFPQSLEISAFSSIIPVNSLERLEVREEPAYHSGSETNLYREPPGDVIPRHNRSRPVVLMVNAASKRIASPSGEGNRP